MTPSFSLTSAAADRVEADLVVVPVFVDRDLGAGAAVIDAAIAGLADFMAEAGFDGKPGETLATPSFGQLGAGAALLVGVGPRDELDADAIRRAGATLARRATKVRTVATTLLDELADGTDRSVAAQALVEGVLLGGYEFLEYKSKAEPSRLASVAIGGRGTRLQAALERGATVGGAVIWARDMVNEPAAAKSPAAFAAAAKKLLRGRGVTVKVLGVAEMRTERLGGVLGVGQGSHQPPRFVKMTYAPRGARGSLALVGKGVIFDSGGLSLKTGKGMETMKTDMGGGAAVIAAMSTLAELDVKTKVTAYVPMVENMPSGTAIRPGDVLKIRNGKTVEVLNTDAEGRLILADALSLAAEAEPDAIVDAATLTGACVVALGDKFAGLMGNHDAWRDQVRDAAARAGEPVWPLPLPKQYRKQIDSEIADIKNIGGSYGGALTAGLFLQEFVGDRPWVHVDIAGPARADANDGELVRGGTGFGVRTLIEVASRFRKPPRR
ncbi:MAG TPA: leucyl aminopeptidase [Acidimicrobiia bacterium]|nr:leucyl aminopeptidase [Acidimicrobiia bacterium]